MCYSQGNFEPDSQHGKILVVDDHAENFSIIEGFLLVLGYKGLRENVINVNNGFHALKQIQKAFEERDPARFTLILIECKMSLIDGYETIKRIKHLFLGIGLPQRCWPKFVATTCMTELKYQEKAKKSGFDQIMTKPLSINKFGELCKDLKLIESIPDIVEKLRLEEF